MSARSDLDTRRRIADEIGRLPVAGRGRYREALVTLFREAEMGDAPLPAEAEEAALSLHRAALARSRLRYYAGPALGASAGLHSRRA